ncbi:hypothetical protein MMC26_007610 [Xylographa opegraphella]|nr:hypothetical protein [Xylographa opegraphella]
MALAGAFSALNEINGPLVTFTKVVTALGGSLLLWRLWRFTLLPTFTPGGPAELPYWIPFVGHAIAFFKDSEGLLTYGRYYFKNTCEIFSIMIAGQKMYIITSPKDVATVYKHPDTLTFEGFIKDMYMSLGMSTEGRAKMFGAQASKDVTSKQPTDQKEAHLGMGVQREQLHPGGHLDDLITTYVKHIKRQMKWENIPEVCKVESNTDQKVVSVRKWCEYVLGHATVEAFFGNVLLELEPSLLDDFHQFDANSWMLLYQYPRPLAGPMFSALDKGAEAFTRYFQLPATKRQPCHYIKTVEAKQRKAEMSDRDIGIAAQGLFWSANANHSKICFWLLAHIIRDSALLKKIREEVALAISKDSIDVQYLVDQCPLLDACLNETLRLCTGASSARNVDVATTIDSLTLSPPAKILIPYRQLHYDEGYFGPETRSFNPSRFLDNKELANSAFFRPFGGGITYCSGRFLARREVLALSAVILTCYEVELDDVAKGIPEMDRTKPTLGVMDAVGGEDLRVRVRSRVI